MTWYLILNAYRWSPFWIRHLGSRLVLISSYEYRTFFRQFSHKGGCQNSFWLHFVMGEEVGTFSRGGRGVLGSLVGSTRGWERICHLHISLNIPSPPPPPPLPKQKKKFAYLFEFLLLIYPGHYSRPRELDDNAYASFFFREVGEKGANKQISWNVLIRGFAVFFEDKCRNVSKFM